MNTTKYNYTFGSNRLLAHEIVMLSKGNCEPFFPTSFIYDSNTITAYYDCSGYIPLSEFRIEHTQDVMYLIEKTLILLQRSQEYMFLPERILLSPETVFYQQETGDLKIAYIPQIAGQTDIHRNLLHFIIGIKEDLCDAFQSYLSIFAHRSCNENLDIDDMLTLAGFLRRQMDLKAKEIA